MNGGAAPRTSPVALAAAFALAGGACELGVVATRRFVMGQMVDYGWEASWMTPASWVLAFLPVGAALLLLRRAAPRFATTGVEVCVPAFLAAFGVLFLFYPTLHWIAVTALSAGIAAQTTRSLAPRAETLARLARRVLVVGFAAIGVAAVAVHGGRAASGALARGRLPEPPAGAPNVLLLVLDTVRASSLSLYGHSRETSPAITALARRGAVFRHAYATAPWTLTSHASMFTGRYPHEMDASDDRPLGDAYPTLSEVLSARGYDTAGFVANILYCNPEMGLGRGFARYEGAPVCLGTLLTASSPWRILISNPKLRHLAGFYDIPGRKTGRDLGDDFLAWLGTGRGRPFFAFLNYFDAHEPYLPEPPWDTRFGPNPEHDRSMIRQISPHRAERSGKFDMTEAERRAEEQAYDSSVAWADSEIGRMLDELGRRGVLDDTIVVVTSDHGELFGEHELFTHANCLYEPLLHVPLVVVSAPRVPPGTSVEAPVSLRDLAATVLDLAGAAPGTLPGTSLVPLLGGGGPAAAPSPIVAEVAPSRHQPANYPVARGLMHTLVDGRSKYIRNGDGVPELYDLASDPGETKDLANDPSAAERLAALRRELDALVPPKPPPAGEGPR